MRSSSNEFWSFVMALVLIIVVGKMILEAIFGSIPKDSAERTARKLKQLKDAREDLLKQYPDMADEIEKIVDTRRIRIYEEENL